MAAMKRTSLSTFVLVGIERSDTAKVFQCARLSCYVMSDLFFEWHSSHPVPSSSHLFILFAFLSIYILKFSKVIMYLYPFP